MSLQQGEIRVHLQGGNSYVCPEGNKSEIINSLGDSVARIEHWKPAGAVATPTPKAVVSKGKTRESLLGTLLVKDKITAGDLIAYIQTCDNLEDLAIVMNGEGRPTIKNAYADRVKEL